MILLFGLSLALTACNVENVLALLADLSPPAAETADDGAAADEDAASDEQADASEPAESSEQPGAGEASEAEGTADSADDEPCINRNEHVANLREPETRPTHRARQRTERRRDADQPDEEPSADEDESEDEQAEQPSERRRERPRDRANPPASEEPAGGGGQSGGLSGIEQQVFDLLNAERQQAGLDALQLDSTLSQGSRAWSRRMATEGFFAHDTGGNFAENIAYGYPSAEAVHRGWMESEGHRNNRMNSRYTSYGVGVFEQDGTIYYTERFR
ncbi:MAG TPA: CAP domain-containing protein [Euzebyales bacterium]|nr:CAP domain-containing protein [Euzebyales bacterium]